MLIIGFPQGCSAIAPADSRSFCENARLNVPRILASVQNDDNNERSLRSFTRSRERSERCKLWG